MCVVLIIPYRGRDSFGGHHGPSMAEDVPSTCASTTSTKRPPTTPWQHLTSGHSMLGHSLGPGNLQRTIRGVCSSDHVR